MKQTLRRVILVALSVLLLIPGLTVGAAEDIETEQVVEFKTITVVPEPPNTLIKQDGKVTVSGKGFGAGGTVTSLGIIPADTDITDIKIISQNLKIIYSSHYEDKKRNVGSNGEFSVITTVTPSMEETITPGIYKVFLWWIPIENEQTNLPYPIEHVAVSSGTFVLSDKNAAEPQIASQTPKPTVKPTPVPASTPTPAPVKDAPIKVTINGMAVDFDVPPQIIDGRTLVPLRKIFESLDAQVAWDATTKTITGTKAQTTVVLKVGSKEATINGISKTLDVPPVIKEGRTLVPARFISESLGSEVQWDQSTKTVIITNH